MPMLTDKEKRTLLFAVRHLFSPKSLLVPKSPSDLHKIPSDQYLSRALNLEGNRTVFLTDSGHEHFRTVVDVIHRANYFDDMAEFSDIAQAWRKIVEKWLSNDLMPECADEVVQAIADLITQEIDDHTFVVPLFGIELDGIDSFALGKMTILRMSIDVLNSAGVAHAHADIPHLLELNKDCLWLKGTMPGTPRVAQQKFSEQAALTVGTLAITAASIYERGASNFRIGIVMTPEDANGRSIWFSWHERKRDLTTHYAFPKGQQFPINKALEDEPDMIRIMHRGLAVLQASNRTELGEALARAIYWYSDAHRDPILVMKLVKYWSCVEAFFSFENEEITHAVSSGLASILVFGGFQFVPPPEYLTLKKQIANLYGHRSKAVHRGAHQHITELDISQFSQWIAWMIINMVWLTEQGYTTLKEVKTQTDHLDGLAEQREGK